VEEEKEGGEGERGGVFRAAPLGQSMRLFLHLSHLFDVDVITHPRKRTFLLLIEKKEKRVYEKFREYPSLLCYVHFNHFHLFVAALELSWGGGRGEEKRRKEKKRKRKKGPTIIGLVDSSRQTNFIL